MTNNELLECLTERPCDVCKFHKEKGCARWDCVFDQREQEPKADVLDKIRAEMAEAKNDAEIKFGHPLGYDRIATYNKCLQIIDKYRKEG